MSQRISYVAISLLFAALLIVQMPCAVSAKKAVATHRKLSEAQALTLIDARPEVKQWRGEVEQAAKSRKVSAHVALDRKDGHEFVVHVYEDVEEDSDNSHTATFGWFYVNELTGKVRKDI